MPQAETSPHDRIAIVMNKRAGTVRRVGVEKIEAAFRAALGSRLVAFHAVSGRHIPASLAASQKAGATMILPIGGDGTCTAVVEAARRDSFTTSALPGGTKNILAKRLWGEQTSLLDIARIIGDGAVKIRHMDVGEANGRLFFVGASFGLIPHLARARERLRGRAEPSGFWAALRHVLRLGRRGLFHPRVVFHASGRAPTRCAALMVSVKSIDEVLLRQGEKADAASFDCAAASPQGWWALTRVALRAIVTDTWRRDDRVDDFNVPELEVDGRNPLVVALDGEVIAIRPPVKLTMLQDAIPLLGAAPIDKKP